MDLVVDDDGIEASVSQRPFKFRLVADRLNRQSREPLTQLPRQ